MPIALAILATRDAELAEADDAERLAVEVGADRALPESAGLEPLALVADVPGELQHQADGDGDGRAADDRRAADHDAALPGRRHVEHEVALAGGDDEA